ncbi:neuronal acetylcholine receptor subunit alpha-9-like [Ptychodera flava]|uniref:neuronal acetylcholine receptor subunit alpha-9-like n=1 Tax=Ptychodera flava TaxID=63121 RepID=UPI003969F3EC
MPEVHRSVVGIAVLFIGLQNVAIASNHSAALVIHLLGKYPRFIRPVKNDSSITVIQHRMTPVQMIEMDERNQIISLKCWLSQIWDDNYLVWNPELYNNTTEIRIPIDNIWQPDVTLVQSVSRIVQRHFDTDVIISNTGQVTALQPFVFEATCTIDSTYFPFDEQKCELTFNAFVNPSNLIDIEPDPASNMENFVSNGEWKLVAMVVQKRFGYDVVCRSNFSEVSYVIHLKRRSLFYILNIMFPFFLTCALVAVSFYLPSESGERITLCVTSILAQFVFLEIITQHMPPNSQSVAYVQKYFFASIGGVAVSALVTAFTLNIHFQPHNCDPVPDWLRVVIFRYCAPIVCLYSSPRRQELCPPLSRRNERRRADRRERLDGLCKRCQSSTTRKTVVQIAAENALDFACVDNVEQETYSAATDEKSDLQILSEWRGVAKILDRLYLLIYLVTIISMIVGFMITLQRNGPNQMHDM